MPIMSFTPVPTLVLVLGQQPPAKQPKRKPKYRSKHKHKHVTTSRVLERIEAAEMSGRVDLRDDSRINVDKVSLTNLEWAILLHLLAPDHYPDPAEVRAPAPTRTAPGSQQRVDVMQRRAAAGEAIVNLRDADPIREDMVEGRASRLGLRGSLPRNGTGGATVAGWHEQN